MDWITCVKTWSATNFKPWLAFCANVKTSLSWNFPGRGHIAVANKHIELCLDDGQSCARICRVRRGVVMAENDMLGSQKRWVGSCKGFWAFAWLNQCLADIDGCTQNYYGTAQGSWKEAEFRALTIVIIRSWSIFSTNSVETWRWALLKHHYQFLHPP